MSIVTDGNGNPVRTSSGQPVTSGNPDGATRSSSTVTTTSPNISVNGVASAVEGAASEVSGAIASSLGGAVNNFTSGLASGFNNMLGGFLGGLFGGFPPLENELEKFATYNSIFTLSALTNFELNMPDFTYKLFGPRNVILRSGGSPDKVRLLSEFSGPMEYYIDDVNIVSVVGLNPQTRQTTACEFNFKVYEPYSMGNFMETIKIAALRAGHPNHLTAPFMLSVEFVGWDQSGNPLRTKQRHFPIRLPELRFEVTEGGSTYDVIGVPYNETALGDNAQSMRTDTEITGRTVEEVLQSGAQSLAQVLNNRLLRLQEAGQVAKADQYVIMFPKERSSLSQSLLGVTETEGGATEGEEREEPFEEERKQELYESINGTLAEDATVPEDFDARLRELKGIVVTRSAVGEAIRDYAQNDENINAIGQSKIVKDPDEAGDQPTADADATTVETEGNQPDRSRINELPELRTFSFAQGTKIQKMIEEVLLASEWGRGIRERLETPDDKGMVEWFRIETAVFNQTDASQVSMTGDTPKVFVYKVVPYMVNANRFNSPTSPSPPLLGLFFNRPKEYNYIYTGENKDILNFDIKFDNAYFLGMNPDRGMLGGNSRMNGQNARSVNSNGQPNIVTNQGQQGVQSATGTPAVRENPTGPTTGGEGGGGADNSEVQIARMFNDAIVNSKGDLVEVDLKIWGDPFYLSDSGIGNYTAGEGFSFNITSDGAMNYLNGEVHVVLNFRTPTDYGSEYMEFPGFGMIPIKQFSGLYHVKEIASEFSGGEFTQELKLIRVLNQESDIRARGNSSGNSILTEGTPENSLDPDSAGSGSSQTGGGDENLEEQGSDQTGGTGATASGDAGDGLRGGSSDASLEEQGYVGSNGPDAATTERIDPNIAGGVS